jgi:hypothetical protein
MLDMIWWTTLLPDERSGRDVHELVTKENPGHTAPSIRPLFIVLHHTIIIENIVMIQQKMCYRQEITTFCSN